MRQINRAAGTVMAAFVLSNLVGLVRQILIARAFATSAEYDAFVTAQRLPDLLFNLVAGGALASAFVPTFTGFLTQSDKAGAWRLASGVINLVFLTTIGIGSLAALGAPFIVQTILAPGFAPAQQALAVDLLRLLLLTTIIFGVSGLLMGILNAHQHFLLPALAPTFYWLGMIVGLLLWVPQWGVFGLAWGAVLGAVLHLAVQLPGLRGLGARYTLTLGRGSAAVGEVLRLMGPRLFGVAAVQLNFIVTASLASYMLTGSASALTYAWQIFTMPQVVIAQSLAIAALPTFSAMVARGELNAMRASLADTLRTLLFLAVPATVGLLLLRVPLIALLFQRERFDAAATALVSDALGWYTLGLVSHSVVEIIARAYYALKDTRTPVVIGAAAMGLNIGLCFAFAALWRWLGWPAHGGLAFANTFATTLEMVALLWLMRRRLGDLAFTRVWVGLRGTLLAAAFMGAVLALWVVRAADFSPWIVTPLGVLGGGLLFWLVALYMKCPEARLLPEMVLRRVGRRGIE